ncbi:MAG TPA: DUF4388 domain-containing protein [Vicinamibacteria bacterium]|nr:DUF4388 domain-containing protein [Vicinamibacteria bacterium]
MADLERTLLTDKVRELYDGRKSGILVVSRDEVSKGIYFRTGAVVFASSTVVEDRLSESLIRLGRISRADFAAAYRAATGQRVGQALVDAGLLTEDELGRMVAHQVEEIVLSLFVWTSGQTRFHKTTDPIPAALALDLSTLRLLFEGGRRFPDVDRLEHALGSLNRRLRVASRPPFDYEPPFTPAERSVLEDAREGWRVADMLDRDFPRAELVRAVYALLVGGILEKPAREPSDVFDVDTGAFRLALATAQQEPSADPREQVLRLYESLPRATHYEVLGVSPQAGDVEIDAAHARMILEQERSWGDLARDPQLGAMLAALRQRRRDAYHVLSDAGRRAEYDRTLGGLRPGKPRTVSAEDRRHAVRLAQEAAKAMDFGDHERAITLCLEGAMKNPDDRSCRRILALAMAQHNALFRAAERHFLAALEFDPTDIELRYAFGLYYKKAGLPARAAAHLRAVLAADPRHEGARRELQELGPRGER